MIILPCRTRRHTRPPGSLELPEHRGSRPGAPRLTHLGPDAKLGSWGSLSDPAGACWSLRRLAWVSKFADSESRVRVSYPGPRVTSTRTVTIIVWVRNPPDWFTDRYMKATTADRHAEASPRVS